MNKLLGSWTLAIILPFSLYAGGSEPAQDGLHVAAPVQGANFTPEVSLDTAQVVAASSPAPQTVLACWHGKSEVECDFVENVSPKIMASGEKLIVVGTKKEIDRWADR